MKFEAIACDYDSTLAHEGRVAPVTLTELRRVRASGRKLILITGRTLRDLQAVFPEISIFNLIIVENGALVFDPVTGAEEPLCAPPAPELMDALKKRNVPFAPGRCVIATYRPYQSVVQQVIDELNLDLEIILNRESVMILPHGIDKASGLGVALERLNLASSEVVGIGDAENDLSFVLRCGLSVAVANAIDSLKREADYVTQGIDGAGVSEIIEQVIAGGPLVGVNGPRG